MKKVALIGVGKMGMSHLAIANMTEGMDVVAVCDTSKLLMRFVRKNTKFEGYTDYKKMISETDLDGVVISVPNSMHFEIAKYCVEQGLHIFVEKPFTLKYENSREVVDLAKANGTKGHVGYVNRFNPVFQKVKNLVDDGVIGDVTNYVNRMTGGVVLSENKGWRNDYSKGGGVLFDYGIHCLDLAVYFFGTEVRVMSAQLKKVFSTNVDDIVYANLLHNNSVVGFNYINWSDSSVRKAGNNIEIFGTKGKIAASKQELSLFLTEGSSKFGLEAGWNQLYITDENTNVGYYLRGEDFSRQMEEFSDLLNGKKDESISSFYTASIVDHVVEAIFSKSGGLI